MPASGGGTVPLRRAPKGSPAPKSKPAAPPPKINLKAIPKPFEGAPKIQAAATKKQAPIPKAGRSDKALKHESEQEAYNQLSYITRRNLAAGMSPQKAVAQASAAVTGKTETDKPEGNTPAQRKLEKRALTAFYKQQGEDRAKTVQEHIFGIPVGKKESPLEAGQREQTFARQPKSIAIVAPNIPGLGKVAATAGAGVGLQKLSKEIPAAAPRHLIGEASELAAMPFLGGVAAGKAGLQYLEGNKEPAKKLVKGLSEGAAGEALKGHFGKALKKAEERPLLAAAEVGGLEAAAGRAAGAAMRGAGSTVDAGGLRGALAKGGNYVRPPVALTEDAAQARDSRYIRQREYSKDSARKLVQLANDMRREPLRDEHGNVVTIHERGREVPVLKGSPKERFREQKKRANYEAGRTQAVETLEREKGRREANKIEGLKGRARTWVAPMRVGEAITRLAAGGTIKHIDSAKADVAKYVERVRKELKNPEAYRDTHELQQATEHLDMLEKALKSPKVNWESAVQRGLEYGRKLREGDVRLKETSIYEPHELEHGALSEYALAHMRAKWGHDVEGREGLIGPDRKLLSVEDIEKHAIKNGRAPETLAYVPHAVTAERPGAYHIPLRVGNRPVTPQLSRKGIVWGRGGMQMDTQLLKDELVAKRVKANNAEAVDQVVKSAGIVRPAVVSGSRREYFTPREGVEAARRLSVDTKVPYVAVRTVPAKLDPEVRKAIKDAQDPAAMETAHRAMLNDRIITDPDVGDQTANVVLMPTAHVQTLADHLMAPKDTERLLQMLNGPFRMAVLPQPRWLAGNFIEPYFIRLPLSGAGVNIPGSAVDFTAATKVLRHMEHTGDPRMVRAALEVRAMQRGGMFVGRRGASYRRVAGEFHDKYAQSLYAAHVVRNLPVSKQMGDMILTIPHTFFHLNRVIESTAQGIALGKSVRNDVQAITGSWLKSLKLGQDSLEQLSKGMVDTATQHRFMEQQYEMLGQYAGFRPSVRRLVASAMPFIPWTLNSLRFSYWTLPMHHTATFAALARLANTVQAEWEAEHKNLPPGELRYALKGKDEGLTSVARYTPFAAPIAVHEGDFQNFTNAAFPEFSGAVEALRGKNFAGQELVVPKTKATPKGKPTPGQKVEIAVNEFLESIIPGLSTARRLREGGGTGYATSTALKPQVKPHTKHGSAVVRTFNPFQPVYLKKTTKAKKAKPAKLGSGIGKGIGTGIGTGGLK